MRASEEDLKQILLNCEPYFILVEMMNEKEYEDYTKEMVEREYNSRNSKHTCMIANLKNMSLNEIEIFHNEQKGEYRKSLQNHSFKGEKQWIQKLEIIHFFKKQKENSPETKGKN